MNRLTIAALATLTLACTDAIQPPPELGGPQASLVRDISIVDLGTLPGAIRSEAWAINNLGQVVGTSQGGPAPGGDAAFLWEPATGMTDLGNLGGDSPDYAYAINNLSQVAGVTSGAVPHVQRAFLWERATGMTDLGFAYARGMNDLGQVVGIDANSAVRWDPVGGVAYLGTLGGPYGAALAINNLGQIVGYSYNGPNENRATLWDPINGIVDLLGRASRADAINDLGQVVGAYTTSGTERAFLWDPTTGLTDLGTLGGDYSRGSGVNNLGQVVGVSLTSTGFLHAFLWEPATGMTDLGTLGGNRSAANGINDLGQVVGWAQRAGEDLPRLNPIRAVLWHTLRPATPIEETQILAKGIGDLVAAGRLPEGQGKALLATIGAASWQIGRGNSTAARNILKAFVHEVEAFVNAGHLSAADAQTLIDAAQNAISQLTV